MNTRNRFSKTVAIATLAASTAMAAAAAAAWSPYSTVEMVMSGYPDGSVAILGLPNSAGCERAWIRFRSETSDPESIQALAISAKLSGQKLGCLVDGCDGLEQSGRSCILVD